MGNNSTSSSVNNNGSSSVESPPSYGGFSFFDFSESDIEEIIYQCHLHSGSMILLGINIFILVTGLPANAGLMWILLSSKRALSASEVLGVNLSILDILFCLCLPLGIYDTMHELSKVATSILEALSALNLFGCPLLLTFMCFERYLAAAHPVAYMRLGKWEYRAVLCACGWVLTLVVALLAYFLGLLSMTIYLALIISLMFGLMLLSMIGIVRVLCQSGPSEVSGSHVPLKRRALNNILAVMVPSFVAYAPLVVMLPFMAVIKSQKGPASVTQCNVLQVLLAFPDFGLYIGPMFYLSRFRQLACRKKDKEQNQNTKIQAE